MGKADLLPSREYLLTLSKEELAEMVLQHFESDERGAKASRLAHKYRDEREEKLKAEIDRLRASVFAALAGRVS